MVFLAIGPAANGNVCFWHIADIDADDEQCPLIGTPRFGLVEHVNAFVNESETKTLASLDRGTNVTQVGLCLYEFRRPNRWKIANIAAIRLKLGVSGRIGASVSIAHAPTYRSCRNQRCTLRRREWTMR